MQDTPTARGSLALAGGQSASNRTPRQINRNLLFQLIRTLQPISRAELSRRSGLCRSTVSLIIEELIQERWIFEGAIGKLPRGRRPILIQLDQHRGVIALDIHPSRTTLAIADLTGTIVIHDIVVPTLESDRALASITAGIHALIDAHPERSFVGMGIGLPGRTDPELQSLIFAPRLNWPVVNLKAHLEEATGLHVEMDNVANACALAEVWFGNSNANDGLIVVNVSEGIAVGIFVNGRILRGRQGMAGEFGHVRLQEEGGVLCACGNHGCWETLASNTAALRYHRELAGDEAAAPTYNALLQLALEGDPLAALSLSRIAAELGRGIRTLLSGLAPREIVIVGELAAVWHMVGPLIEAEMRQGFITNLPMLRCTGGGDETRLRGAVALILSKASV